MGTLSPWTTAPTGFQTAIVNERDYRVYVKAKDGAGNWAGDAVYPYDVVSVYQPFRWDVTRPTSVLTTPSLRYLNSVTSLAGTAADPGDPSYAAGIEKVQVAVQRTDQGGNNCWSWTAKTFSLSQANEAIWTDTDAGWSTSTAVGMMISSATYRIYSRAWDRAGNKQSVNLGVDNHVFTFDNIPPWWRPPRPRTSLITASPISP